MVTPSIQVLIQSKTAGATQSLSALTVAQTPIPPRIQIAGIRASTSILCSRDAANQCASSASSAHTGSVAGNKSDPPTLRSEMLSLSGTFKFIMNVQLVLMLFLALAWHTSRCDFAGDT
jgi:hypothetical protein